MFCRCFRGDPSHPEEEPGRRQGGRDSNRREKAGMEVGSGQVQRPGLKPEGQRRCRGGDGLRGEDREGTSSTTEKSRSCAQNGDAAKSAS